MSLQIREVRVPTKRARAERILAALEATGPVGDYSAAGAINPGDGAAVLRTKEADLDMTLADGTVVGETIHLKCIQLRTPGVDTVVVTPDNLTGGTDITFDAKDQSEVLIWVGAAWTPRPGGSATIA